MPHSNRQAGCRESSGIVPETAVGCIITRGDTRHLRIAIVKMQGSLRDIREAHSKCVCESDFGLREPDWLRPTEEKMTIYENVV
jgi:hypothetical protein